MVERPIKKSERPAKAEAGEETSSSSRGERSRSGKGGKGRDSRKGKRGDRDEAPKPPVNPALMRGPRPVQAKPVVEEPQPEETADVEISAESGDEVEATAEPEPAEA